MKHLLLCAMFAVSISCGGGSEKEEARGCPINPELESTIRTMRAARFPIDVDGSTVVIRNGANVERHDVLPCEAETIRALLRDLGD